MDSNGKVLARGSLLRVFAFALNIVVAFFLMPFIIHSLGDRMYGLWVVIGSLLGFYGLFDLGLSSAVKRYVSKALGKKDYKEANEVANTSFFIFLIVGLLTLIISVIIGFIAPFFLKSISEAKLFMAIVIIMGSSLAIGFPMRVFLGILISNFRYDLVTSVQLFKLIIRTVLVVVFLKLGHGILALALITVIADFFGYIIMYTLTKRIAPYIAFSYRFIDKTNINSLFKYSIFTFISRIADRLRFNIDSLVIAAFVGLKFVTVYFIASRLIMYFIDFITEALGLMIPVFSQYEAKGDYDSIREKFILVTKLSSYLSILVGGTLIIFGKSFIERWMGPKYLSAYPILVVLVIPIVVALMQSPSIQLLYGISKHKFFALSNSVEGISNLILSLILVRKFGLMGVALGTAIPMIVIKLFVQPIYTCKVIKLPIRKYYIAVIGDTLLQASLILAVFWLAFHRFVIPNYLSLLTLATCMSLLYGIIIFNIGFKNSEREYFMRLLPFAGPITSRFRKSVAESTES